MEIDASEKDLYRLSVNAGLAIAIKNLALENAFITYTDESREEKILLLKDYGRGILNLIQAYFPEEYEYTLSKLKRKDEAEREEARKLVQEKMLKLLGDKSEVNENGKESV